jgi:hypothetical protein
MARIRPRAHEKRALLVGFRKTGKTAIKFGKSYDGRGTVSQRESLGRCLKLRARAKLACDATKVNDFNPYREGRNEPGPLWGLGLVGQCREAAVHAALPIAGPQSAHRHAGCWIVWQHIVHPVRPDEPAAANCTTDQTKTGLSLAAARKTILIFAGHSRLVQLRTNHSNTGTGVVLRLSILDETSGVWKNAQTSDCSGYSRRAWHRGDGERHNRVHWRSDRGRDRDKDDAGQLGKPTANTCAGVRL